MSKASDDAKARATAVTVLGSQNCNVVRFRLDNVTIGTMMYQTLGTGVKDNLVHVTVGNGRSYDHATDTITFDAKDPPDFVVIHEATHAVIDMAHDGKVISRGTHEACAYLAETIFSLAVTNSVNNLVIPFLTRPVAQLAARVLANNQSAQSHILTCDPQAVSDIKAIIGRTMDVTRTDRMNGIKGM